MYRERTGPLARYFEARLLMYAQPGRSREVLEGMLRAHPEFVWPHLEFVEWSALPGRKAEDTVPHLKAFTAACPETLIPGAQGLLQDAAAMRRALGRRNSWLDLTSWAVLWTAEEKAGVSAEALQAHVRADLKRIESWPFRPYPRLPAIYREAARILHDDSVVQDLQTRVDREAPDSLLASGMRRDKWDRENPSPKPEDRKARQEYEDRKAATEREWVRQWPNDYASLQDLWILVSTQSRGVPGSAGTGSAENLAVVDRWVQHKQISPDAVIQFPPVETSLARFYVAAKVRLDQVPKLLNLGLRNVEIQSKYAIPPEAFPEEMRSRITDWREITATQTAQIRADYFLAANRPAEARPIIEQALAKLQGQQGGRTAFDRSEWLRRLADVEATEGLAEQALAHYQATLGLPKERVAESVAQSSMVAAIKRYYLAHGGTEEQWPEWASAKTEVSSLGLERTPPVFIKVLPDFTAKDLSGRTWQLSDLRNKATFVDFWATWCGPCRGEHAYVQKLYETVRERKDMQVLTFSVDESPGAVRDYVKEKGYTFPVIHAPELADQLYPYAGLPTSFLVNAEGMRTSMYGFGSDSEGLRRLIEDLELAAKPR